MSQSPTPLRDSLENLRDRAAETQPKSEQAKQVLADLQAGVQATLARPGEPEARHAHGLREPLTSSIAHFEDEHAELVLAIQVVLDNLSAIGL